MCAFHSTLSCFLATFSAIVSRILMNLFEWVAVVSDERKMLFSSFKAVYYYFFKRTLITVYVKIVAYKKTAILMFCVRNYGADFKGHVGMGNRKQDGNGKIMWSERTQCREGQTVLDFAKGMNMAVMNSFQKGGAFGDMYV